MKKMFFVLLLAIPFWMCSNPGNSQTTNNQVVTSSKKIEVFYFHYTRRCITCQAVEDVAKKSLEENFSKQVQNKEITFTSLNLDEETSKTASEKYQISGQALIFVCEGKTVDLTNDGFMHAKNSPDKFKEIVKKTVENLLK